MSAQNELVATILSLFDLCHLKRTPLVLSTTSEYGPTMESVDSQNETSLANFDGDHLGLRHVTGCLCITLR